MKTKFIFLAIVTVVALVGYSTYRQYSTLKSVNSYASCVSAQGSILQMTYPATCITRLGARFTEPLTIVQQLSMVSPASTANWKTYSDTIYKFSLKYPPEMIISQEKDVRDLYLTINHFKSNSRDFTIYVGKNSIEKEVASIRTQVEGHEIITLVKNEEFQFNKVAARLLAWESENGIYLDVIVPIGDKVIVVSGKEDMVIPVLSTFKFTN